MPCAVMSGRVIAEEPLRIQVEQKFILEREQLLLTGAVEDREIVVEMNHQTEPAGGHSHGHGVTVHRGDVLYTGSTENDTEADHAHRYAGRKTMRLCNRLKTGDAVILLRLQGGQKFLVLDKAVGA